MFFQTPKNRYSHLLLKLSPLKDRQSLSASIRSVLGTSDRWNNNYARRAHQSEDLASSGRSDGRQFSVIAAIMSGPIEAVGARSRFFAKRTDPAGKFPPDVFRRPFVIFRLEISFPSADLIDIPKRILPQDLGRHMQPHF